MLFRIVVVQLNHKTNGVIIMALVPGICTQCGATLSADTSKDCMICPYCGMPFIVDKAIDRFSNRYGGSNAGASSRSGNSNDFVIRAGVLEKYTGSGTVVVIPRGIVAIGDHAFAECYGLTEVTIPEGVTCIKEWAFSWCEKLEKVSLPDSLRELSSHAFCGCVSLERISLPDGLQKLEGNVFGDCVSLSTVKMPDNGYGKNHSIIGLGTFSECKNLRNVSLPNESWFGALAGTPYYDDYQRKRQQQREKVFKIRGLCAYCGGSFCTEGFIKVTEKCSKCGRPKDY